MLLVTIQLPVREPQPVLRLLLHSLLLLLLLLLLPARVPPPTVLGLVVILVSARELPPVLVAWVTVPKGSVPGPTELSGSALAIPG